MIGNICIGGYVAADISLLVRESSQLFINHMLLLSSNFFQNNDSNNNNIDILDKTHIDHHILNIISAHTSIENTIDYTNKLNLTSILIECIESAMTIVAPSGLRGISITLPQVLVMIFVYAEMDIYQLICDLRIIYYTSYKC